MFEGYRRRDIFWLKTDIQLCGDFLCPHALVHFAPLRLVSQMAWSETIGMAFVMATLCLLAGQSREDEKKYFRPAAAGLLAGLAVAARYALLPLLALGLLAYFDKRSKRLFTGEALPFLAGFSAIALPMFLRNIVQAGHLGGSTWSAEGADLGQVFRELWQALVHSFVPEGLVPLSTLTLIAFFAVGRPIVWAARSDARKVFDGLPPKSRQSLILLWPLLYLVFLVLAQTRVKIDAIDMRLVFPATLILFVYAASFLAKVAKFPPVVSWVMAMVLLVSAVAGEWPQARRLARASLPPVYDMQAKVERAPLLGWLSENVTSGDLLIAEDGLDLPLYLGPVDIVFWSIALTPELPLTLARIFGSLDKLDACAKYGRVLLVLRTPIMPAASAEARYGPDVARLANGGEAGELSMERVFRSEDGSVFWIPCGPEAGAR